MTMNELKDKCKKLGVEIHDFDSAEYLKKENARWKDGIEKSLSNCEHDLIELIKVSKSIQYQLWIAIGILVVGVILTYCKLNNECGSRFHYKTSHGEMFDSKEGRVIDIDNGKIVYEAIK